MAGRSEVYFVSDVHLGLKIGDPAEREARFTGFLKFISVPAKWGRTSRQYVLNIYSCNNAYADVFLNDFG